MAARRRILPAIPRLPVPIKVYAWAGVAPNSTPPTIFKRLVYCLAIYLFNLSNRLNLASAGLIPMRDLKLPHAGGRFNDPTPLDCAERLVYLQRLGYKVPQYAIDALVVEAMEELK